MGLPQVSPACSDCHSQQLFFFGPLYSGPPFSIISIWKEKTDTFCPSNVLYAEKIKELV